MTSADLLAQIRANCEPPKVSTCRLLKVECVKCGYVARTTRKWLDLGAPICPVDNIAMVEGSR